VTRRQPRWLISLRSHHQDSKEREKSGRNRAVDAPEVELLEWIVEAEAEEMMRIRKRENKKGQQQQMAASVFQSQVVNEVHWENSI
jgi:hypothetical protein